MSPFVKIFLNIFEYVAWILMFIGGLVLICSSGLAASQTPMDHARVQELKSWKSEPTSIPRKENTISSFLVITMKMISLNPGYSLNVKKN
jgi:hypothetical protein